MIESLNNYNNVFIRDVTVGLLALLENKIYWNNMFKKKNIYEKKLVTVPFRYAYSNDSRFLQDLFVDDIVNSSRFNELNTDSIPMGVIVLKSVNVNKSATTNPNVPLTLEIINNDTLDKIITNVNNIPINLVYDCEIRVSSEVDYYKCIESILDTLYPTRYYFIELYGKNSACQISLNDDFSIAIEKSTKMQGEANNYKTISFNINVKCTYLSFMKRRDVNTDYKEWSDIYNYVENENDTDEYTIAKKSFWTKTISVLRDSSSKKDGTDLII